jgi:uncharacterized OB-fold protein
VLAESKTKVRINAWRCAACGRTSYPPRRRCPSCWSVEGLLAALPTVGKVHSYTTVHVGRPGTEVPYTVAYVDTGGVRLFARLEGEPRVGARGRIRTETGTIVVELDDG